MSEPRRPAAPEAEQTAETVTDQSVKPTVGIYDAPERSGGRLPLVIGFLVIVLVLAVVAVIWLI